MKAVIKGQRLAPTAESLLIFQTSAEDPQQHQLEARNSIGIPGSQDFQRPGELAHDEPEHIYETLAAFRSRHVNPERKTIRGTRSNVQDLANFVQPRGSFQNGSRSDIIKLLILPLARRF